ncbi:MAG: DNA alkylation repair protein [Alphaproteobacteria bacterium]|nr:DNA alkylation repair protein [Alphaproteobacteria bacterium]
MDALRQRKGASKIADIPPVVLEALNCGLIETKTLVEWLAIHTEILATHVAQQLRMNTDECTLFIQTARQVLDKGVTQRQKQMGQALAVILQKNPALSIPLKQHPSDMVRSWHAYAVAHLHGHNLDVLLDELQHFAADPSMSTRECTWDAWRPYLARNIDKGIDLLMPWVVHEHDAIRRCAIEGTRPRGVWTCHLPELKLAPEKALPLLEKVKTDPSRYVQNAVANWLNDASKDHPVWVMEVTSRWQQENDCTASRYIIKRSRRTIQKNSQQ